MFSRTVEHHQIDETNWDTIYVIGDVHAAATELNEFIDHLNISNDDLIIFVGDLIRKGPHSKQVLEYVMKHENMLSIRGDNEQKNTRR